ncbi:hypothetical protein [Ornithinimicrobium kibberense]|uniref:hypothetical protein n=1 Tax=Ornithinimicrobium kibberense TaxID=282060 RepID=UPI003624112C
MLAHRDLVADAEPVPGEDDDAGEHVAQHGLEGDAGRDRDDADAPEQVDRADAGEGDGDGGADGEQGDQPGDEAAEDPGRALAAAAPGQRARHEQPDELAQRHADDEDRQPEGHPHRGDRRQLQPLQRLVHVPLPSATSPTRSRAVRSHRSSSGRCSGRATVRRSSSTATTRRGTCSESCP